MTLSLKTCFISKVSSRISSLDLNPVKSQLTIFAKSKLSYLVAISVVIVLSDCCQIVVRSSSRLINLINISITYQSIVNIFARRFKTTRDYNIFICSPCTN